MIEETYCSFEVAKLLKEKGFNEVCHSVHKYNNNPDIKNVYSYQFHITIDEIDEKDLLRPTHQMAMAWLREVHNIFIIIEPYSNTSCYFSLWEGNDIYRENPLRKDFPSYEETVEAALKYILKNLI